MLTLKPLMASAKLSIASMSKWLVGSSSSIMLWFCMDRGQTRDVARGETTRCKAGGQIRGAAKGQTTRCVAGDQTRGQEGEGNKLHLSGLRADFFFTQQKEIHRGSLKTGSQYVVRCCQVCLKTVGWTHQDHYQVCCLFGSGIEIGLPQFLQNNECERQESSPSCTSWQRSDGSSAPQTTCQSCRSVAGP